MTTKRAGGHVKGKRGFITSYQFTCFRDAWVLDVTSGFMGINPLMPDVCVTFLLPPGIKGLKIRLHRIVLSWTGAKDHYVVDYTMMTSLRNSPVQECARMAN